MSRTNLLTVLPTFFHLHVWACSCFARMLRWRMETENAPEDLEHDFVNFIREYMPSLRELTAKPKHIPGDEFYHQFAKRLIAHLKRRGVERIVRRTSPAHPFPKMK
jgi:hypothetical protein